MEKINVAELLKDCPQGMELDCTMFDTKVIYKGLNKRVTAPTHPIVVQTEHGFEFELTQYGQIHNIVGSKCVIFPKGKTTWEGFVPPCRFKDGDVVFTTLGNIAIIRKPIGGELFCVYGIMVGNGFYKDETTKVVVARLATEEEKQKLFNAIKKHGYKWNVETKTFEKLPKFKVGDRVRNKNYKDYIYDIYDIIDKGYIAKGIKTGSPIPILFGSQEDNYELVPNKFDITTLKPFDKVLVRDNKGAEWIGGILSHANYEDNFPFKFTDCAYKYCIPYNDDTKHLVGTTDDCDEFYKT